MLHTFEYLNFIGTYTIQRPYRRAGVLKRFIFIGTLKRFGHLVLIKCVFKNGTSVYRLVYNIHTLATHSLGRKAKAQLFVDRTRLLIKNVSDYDYVWSLMMMKVFDCWAFDLFVYMCMHHKDVDYIQNSFMKMKTIQFQQIDENDWFYLGMLTLPILTIIYSKQRAIPIRKMNVKQ